jgi:hypothetical protein
MLSRRRSESGADFTRLDCSSSSHVIHLRQFRPRVFRVDSLAFNLVGRRNIDRHHHCALPGSPLLIDYDKRVADS